MLLKIYCLLILVVVSKGIDVNNMKLKQVLILSRHNVRYGMNKYLQRYSPKPWPKSNGPPGYLTPRGALLEGYMGEYFSEWFKKEQFMPKGCPKTQGREREVYVYADIPQRTVETAKAFVDSAFKNCNVSVYYENIEDLDTIFTPVIYNKTEGYKEMVIQEVKRKMDNNLKLKAVYLELNKILDIKDSDVCKEDSICDLTDDTKSSIIYGFFIPIWVNGPLSIANSVTDSFIMSYYDGAPIENIAWGQITTPEKWKLMAELGRQDQDIRYTTVAKDFGEPLVRYIIRIFKNYEYRAKLTLLVGHAYNLNSVSASLGFKSFDLPDHYEKFPIGGKIVFQRWTNGTNDYLKIEYVYATWTQIRNADKLSLNNPPGRVPLQLNWCRTDEHHFCSWDEFIHHKLQVPVNY